MCCVVGLIGRVVQWVSLRVVGFSHSFLLHFVHFFYNVSYHLRFVRYEIEIGNQRFPLMLDLSSNRFVT